MTVPINHEKLACRLCGVRVSRPNLSKHYEACQRKRVGTNYTETPFGQAALAVIDRTFGGVHHVGELRWFDNGTWAGRELHGVSFGSREETLSTWDSNRLTRLVVACHDHCIRGEISPGGPRQLKVTLTERVLNCDDPSVWSHPGLDEAVAVCRGKVSLQWLYDRLRERKRAPNGDYITWQCSNCRHGFTGPHRRVCPNCNKQDYWTGSVGPDVII